MDNRYAKETPPASLVLFLSAGGGAAVATLYYSQPLLGVLGADMGVSEHAVGWIPTLTQFGYALGILFLAPLGDRYDRRTIIMIKTILLAAALLFSAISPSMAPLLAASLCIGITATLAQDIVPTAAQLAPDAQRGRILGTIMTGLLLGIVLSRVASGYVAAYFGWRTVFYVASASIVLVGIGAWRKLPKFKPPLQHAYGALLISLLELWQRYPKLRRAAVAQGLLSIGFSAFWSTLAVMLYDEPFRLGSEAAGTFGLAGAAGALAAPIAGRIADRKGPEMVTRLGTILVALSFATMFFMPTMSPVTQLYLLGLAAVGFDLGIQATLIAHQTIIYALDPEARSRVNAVLFVGMFTGMAVGSAVGSALQTRWGWPAVTMLATASALAAFMTRLVPTRE